MSHESYNIFLSSIKNKYLYYFKNDIIHINEFTTALKTKSLNAFLHVIESSISFINQSVCLYCRKKDSIRTLSKIAIFNKQLAVFFTSYYACPIHISQNFFSSLKSAIYTTDGMHLFDLNTTLINFFKYNNQFTSDKCWFLCSYCEMESIELFVENKRFIDTSKKYDKFALLALTGTIIEPKHFYAIFIDKKNMNIFIYNSCPEIESLKKGFLAVFFKNYKIYANKYKNQFNNDLCGFFAASFLKEIAYSNDFFKVFEKYNQKKNLDDFILSRQNNFVLPVNENVKLVYLFLKSWSFE